MFERSWSDGISDRSATVSASSNSAIAVWTLLSMKRPTPSRKSTSARSTSEKASLSVSARARSSSAIPSRTSPRRRRTMASPESARTSSSARPVASTAERMPSNSASASSLRRASTRASHRASAASTRPRSSAETPFARKPASTPSRSASHWIVSPVGRVLPRSIWLTYSFEKRSPASSVCVIPAATRSCRSRSPRRSPAWAASTRCCCWRVAVESDMYGVVDDILHQISTRTLGHPPKRSCSGRKPVKQAYFKSLDRAT
jgi:hypothetical protein